MKKRLRKKYHLGEFKGQEVDLECTFIECTDKSICDDFFEKLINKIEELGLSCTGKSLNGSLKFSVYCEGNKKLNSTDIDKLTHFLQKNNHVQSFNLSELHDEIF